MSTSVADGLGSLAPRPLGRQRRATSRRHRARIDRHARERELPEPLPRIYGEAGLASDFGGVSADGTLTTHTTPAGQIGNEKPIVVTAERWFAPDLHVVVYAKTADPRSGETTYRLANLKREEPAADLFKVPADYKGVERR